jgi:hypothetical protein
VRKSLADQVFELFALHRYEITGLAPDQNYLLIFKGAVTIVAGQIIDWDTDAAVESILPKSTRSKQKSDGVWHREDGKEIFVTEEITSNNSYAHR